MCDTDARVAAQLAAAGLSAQPSAGLLLQEPWNVKVGPPSVLYLTYSNMLCCSGNLGAVVQCAVLVSKGAHIVCMHSKADGTPASVVADAGTAKLAGTSPQRLDSRNTPTHARPRQPEHEQPRSALSSPALQGATSITNPPTHLLCCCSSTCPSGMGTLAPSCLSSGPGLQSRRLIGPCRSHSSCQWPNPALRQGES
jgi:hypothetical protein